MWNEFKNFAFKGNVLDMAVGVVIGSAFGKIVTSLVNDIIMPVIGVMTAGVDFKDLKWVMSAAVMDGGNIVSPEAAILYGNFIQNIVDFLIVAVSIFIFVRLIGKLRLKQKAEEAAAQPAVSAPSSEELLTEIRDYLKQQAK